MAVGRSWLCHRVVRVVHDLFVTTPKGMESLLAAELRQLGIGDVRPSGAGVGCRATLEQALRICLWSRLASRVLLALDSFRASSPEELYAGVRAVDWSEHLSETGTLAVDCHVRDSKITHSRYAALTVKDAVVDQLRERTGTRPSVDVERPDIRINLYVLRNRARLSLDLSGAALHRRGYRSEGVVAPLKENLAAALLIEAGWPQRAAAGEPFVDPMCGSGTLPIEAALMAADIAPGLQRDYYGFPGWRGHDAALWRRLLEEARQRRDTGLQTLPKILGFDIDGRAVRAAHANLAAAGLTGRVHIERRALADARCEGCGERRGLVLVNPPYGERIGADSDLPALYREIGQTLRAHFPGWRACLFTGNTGLESRLGLKREKKSVFHNGALACELICYPVPEAEKRADGAPGEARDFANRLRKNLKRLQRWAQREGIGCYRVYDADLPDYNFAVDLYQGEGRWVHAQEYQAPARIDPERAERRRQAALGVIAEVLEVSPDNVFYKVRRRQKGAEQYQRQGRRGRFYEVGEYGCRLRVNFEDYLDTGLFLDHRPVRRRIQDEAAGKRFLNLFCYTGVATVHAAAGGAVSSVSVDLSARYLEWAEQNLRLNGVSTEQHRLVRADVMQWLKTPDVIRQYRGQFDLVFVDPPVFSNSKRMDDVFDVQKHHVELIRRAMALLAPGGQLIFSTNLRRFRLDCSRLDRFVIEDISRASIPEDFSRRANIHHCFILTHRGVG